jgi:hypothetical protein
MIGKFLDFKAFICSLAFGLFLVYLYQPSPSIIYVYPTPDNTNNLQFMDKAKNCFKFDAIEIACPDNSSDINNIPIQESGHTGII